MTPIKINNFDNSKFSQVYFYKYNRFGNLENGLHSFSIELNVSQLNRDFKIFTELNEIEKWPISQLIQREVDEVRCKNIARNYLLNETDRIKMFPPLTVALIPVNDSGTPLAHYKDMKIEEEYINKLKSVNQIHDFKICKKSSADGIFNFKSEVEDVFGQLIWDKTKIHAVVIDGQHRMKALLEAMKSNKEAKIEDWLLSLNIVDLSDYINKIKASDKNNVIFLVRDIFMDMNNTSVAVDLSRRILINNNNPISLIVQSLIENEKDFDWDKSPLDPFDFIPPQLIDWYCSAGKHDTRYLTGVITLFQVIEFAIFFNLDVDKIKNTKKNIIRWKDRVEAAFGIDEVLESNGRKKLGDIIDDYYNDLEDIELDEGDEIEEISFQYDNDINKYIQDKFEEFYKQAILLIYFNLLPYARNLSMANDHGLFNPQNPIFRFSRMTESKRNKIKENLDDNEKRTLKLYNSEYLKSIRENNFQKYFILTSVMGQKAILRYFFKNFMVLDETRSSKDSINISTLTEIEKFNKFVNFIETKSKYKDFFTQEFPMPNTSSNDRIDKMFWEGIITKNKNIIYTKNGIDSLIFVIEYIFGIATEDYNKTIHNTMKSIIKTNKGKGYSKLEDESKEYLDIRINFLKKLREDFRKAT